MSFFVELKRRNVFKVAVAYAIVAWLLVQITSTVAPALHLPDWTLTFIVYLTIIGFPLALFLAWAFELTPEGIKPTSEISQGESISKTTGQKLNYTIIALLSLAVVFLVLDNYLLTEDRSQKSAVRMGNTTGSTVARVPLSGDKGSMSNDSVKPSIAVLPFADLSPNKDQEYFSDGLSEELLNQLAQLHDLRVIGRTSSFAFKGKNEDLRAIGATLGVNHILEGSVRKDGDRLRITAQLINAVDGSHLWSQTYDRKLDDVFAIQEDIARAVTGALSVTLGIGETLAATGKPVNVDTYDHYLRANALSDQAATVKDFEHAATLYREILARDPGFTRARGGLAQLYVNMMIAVPEHSAGASRSLEQVVAEALVQAPDDWATHLASALLRMQRYQWAESDAAFARAAELAPASDSHMSINRAELYMGFGRARDAIDLLKAAGSIDPLSLGRSFDLQLALDMIGRMQEADTEYRRIQDLDKAREDITHLALMRVWNGKDNALIEARFDHFLERQTVPASWYARVRAVYRDAGAARAVIRAAFDDPANQDPTRQALIGIYAGHYGDPQLALAAIRRATVDMHSYLVDWLWYPDLAAVRRTPGFKALVRDLGLVDYWRKSGNWGDFCRPVGEDDFECR